MGLGEQREVKRNEINVFVSSEQSAWWVGKEEDEDTAGK